MSASRCSARSEASAASSLDGNANHRRGRGHSPVHDRSAPVRVGRADPDRLQLRQQGRLGRISKQGSHLVRWALIEAAQKTPTGGVLREQYERIAKRRGAKVAKVAMAREILTLSYRGLRDGEIRRRKAPAPASRMVSASAWTLRAQGELGAARELEEQVLAGRREVLGERHPDTLTAMNNLAQTRSEQGDFDAARQLAQQLWRDIRLASRAREPEVALADLASAAARRQRPRRGRQRSR